MRVVGSEPRVFAFYLLPDFTLLAFSSAVEALRLANTALGYEAYAWRVVSSDGGKVRASCGVSLDVDHSIAAERQLLNGQQRPSVAVVCGGKQPEHYVDRAAEAWVRECRNRAISVAGLCTGSRILAKAGLLNDKRCAIHWETQPGFAERFQDADVGLGIYEIDRNVYTCAGGAAALDMMIHIIGRDHDDSVVNGICELALIDRVRRPGDRQRIPFAKQLGVQDPILMKLVEQMVRNLTDRVDMEQLVDLSGRSRRQIERLFRNKLGCSPARYYLKLRLERAQLLLLQTTIPVVEVAIACGFVAGSHFAKCYREEFGCAPLETRSCGMRTPVVYAEPLAVAA